MGSRAAFLEQGDTPLEYQEVVFGQKRKVPPQVLNQRIRLMLMDRLLQGMPELFTEEEVMLTQGRSKYHSLLTATIILLYGGSIIIGRRVIAKHQRLPALKMSVIYLTPLSICLPLIIYTYRVKKMQEVAKISKKYESTITNEQIFAYMLPFYAYRFKTDRRYLN